MPGLPALQWLRTALLALVLAGWSLPAVAQTTAEAPAPPAIEPRERRSDGPVRLAIFTVSESKDPATYSRLRARPDMRAAFVRGADIRAGKLDHFDVLLVPGGSGSKQAAALEEDGREQVRRFVRSGGGYLGICAGGYLATCGYDWSLAILDAKTIDTRHWARGKGNVQIELSPNACQLLKASDPKIDIFYANGPILARGERDDLADFETLAEYRTEVVKEGVPGGVMPNTPAAVRGTYGHGRVIVFSCHPDIPQEGVTPHLVDWLPRAVYWAADRQLAE
jgi:glutamine amidotransferase-like uncharacterized protein